MSDTTPIHSSANPLVKEVRAVLQGRDSSALVVEGERLIVDALASGLAVRQILVAESRADLAEDLSARGVQVRRIADSLLGSLTKLVTSPGSLALFETPTERGGDSLPSHDDALVLVAAGLQNPGNLGGLARSAEAAGASALVVTAGGCRPWNEKALRGSMGSLLRLPIHEIPLATEAWDALAGLGFRQVFAEARGGATPGSLDWSGRVALWVFPEHGELPAELVARSREAEHVTIPMRTGVESLNVGVAAAVLLFAADRVGQASTPSRP